MCVITFLAMNMGNSSPTPTPPTTASSSAAAAASAAPVLVEVGRYYHYKGRTTTGMNEETGDCLVFAEGSQPNTWNIKMLVSKRSYTGCPTSLFSKPMMESSGRGRRPSSSSSSSSLSTKSPGYSVTSASVTSSQSSSLPSSQSSNLQIEKKRKQPISSPIRQLQPVKKAVITGTIAAVSSSTLTGTISSSTSNNNTSSSSSSSSCVAPVAVAPKKSNKLAKTAASAVAAPVMVKPANTATSNDATKVKDVITRWPQINDEIQYSIVIRTSDGEERITGKWQPGVVTAVCPVKAQLTLTLHAIDYNDHDGELSSAGAKRRTFTVDYPDPRLIVHFSDGLVPVSVRNGGYPLYPPSSVAFDVTLKDVLRDPDSFRGLEFSEWFDHKGTGMATELWGTVMKFKDAQSNDLKTFDINWSDNHKLYYKAPELVVRLNRNRANEREGKNGYKLEISASGRSVRARALTVNPNLPLESPSPKKTPQRQQQRQQIPPRQSTVHPKNTHIKMESQGYGNEEMEDTEGKIKMGKRKIPLSAKVGMSSNNGSTSDVPLKKMKLAVGGGAGGTGGGGMKTAATASKKIKSSGGGVRGRPSKANKSKSLNVGGEDMGSEIGALATSSYKVLTKSPKKVAGRGGGGRGRKLPPPVSPKSIPVSFMTYMTTTSAASSSSFSASASTAVSASSSSSSSSSSLVKATSGDGSGAGASALTPLHELPGYYQKGGVRYIVGMLSGPLGNTESNGYNGSGNVVSSGSMSGVVVGTGLPHLASNVLATETGTEKQVGEPAASSTAITSVSASGAMDIRHSSSSTTTKASSVMTIQGSKLFLRLLSHTGDADESKMVSMTTTRATLSTALSSTAYANNRPLTTTLTLPTKQQIDKLITTVVETARGALALATIRAQRYASAKKQTNDRDEDGEEEDEADEEEEEEEEEGEEDSDSDEEDELANMAQVNALCMMLSTIASVWTQQTASGVDHTLQNNNHHQPLHHLPPTHSLWRPSFQVIHECMSITAIALITALQPQYHRHPKAIDALLMASRCCHAILQFVDVITHTTPSTLTLAVDGEEAIGSGSGVVANAAANDHPMQPSPAERVFTPLLEHLTHLLRAHGAMLCSTVYTSNHRDTNHNPTDQSPTSLDDLHQDIITSLALISNQSLVAGCGLLRSVGSILLAQGNHATPVAWSRLLFPTLPTTHTASCAGNGQVGITCDEGLALALLMPPSATKHQLLTVSLLKKNKQMNSGGIQMADQSNRTALNPSSETKMDEQHVMIQDADACTLELITQLSTMLVSTGKVEEKRGGGCDGEVGVRSERSTGAIKETKETPKNKVKGMTGKGISPKGGSGRGARTTPKSGGKQGGRGGSTLSAGKQQKDGDDGGVVGPGGRGDMVGVQIPLSCGWCPLLDNDRIQSKELIQQVDQSIDLEHLPTIYDGSEDPNLP